MLCELCGKEHDGTYGSGRFCSARCARSFSTSANLKQINLKRSIALKNTKIYSNGIDTIHIRDGDEVPDGYIEGNFAIVKHHSFEEFKRYKTNTAEIYTSRDKKKRNKTIKMLLSEYKSYIDTHNKYIISQYEDILCEKSIGKSFEIPASSIVKYAGYDAVICPSHPRSNAKRVFIHILLAEKLLGRYLEPSEIVHHKNENKLDNRFDNIYIFKDKAHHARFHYAKIYWLRIEKDVLICEPIDFSKLKLHDAKIE